MSVQNSFCSLQLLPKHVVQTNRNKANCVKFSLLFLCAITHKFWYWKELSQVTIRVNRFDMSFSGSICITLTVYSTGRYGKCFKNGEHQKLFQRSVHTIQFWSNYHFKFFFVYDEKCWRSHNPVFPSYYFVMYSRETREFLFWECRPISPQLGPAVAAILWKKFAESSVGKLKIGGSFDRMEIEHVLFSSNRQKMSETCQKLAFTHPIVVLKSGLKNNWMKKLDRVNRP